MIYQREFKEIKLHFKIMINFKIINYKVYHLIKNKLIQNII